MIGFCARASAMAARCAAVPAAPRVLLPRARVPAVVGLRQRRFFSEEKQTDIDAGDNSPQQHADRVATLDIEGFTAANLKPDTGLEIAFPPYGMCPASIKVKFPGSGELKAIPPEMAKSVPMLSLTGGNKYSQWDGEGGKFTVIMTDPDAPSRESAAFREFIHYAVTDVPHFPDDSLSLADGAQAVPWVQPAPPCKSGLHRYIFLVFAQPEGVTGAAVYMGLMQKLGDRGGKKAVVVAKELGLGDPVAYGGFMAEWDKSCDGVHEKIGFLPPPGMRSPKQVEKHGDA